MKSRAQIRLLEDGRRLHLHDGPIDLIIEAFGEPRDQRCLSRSRGTLCQRPRRTLWRTRVFATGQRAETVRDHRALSRDVWWQRLHLIARETFITPMAAVAGAVAEEILGTMTAAAKLSRAYVNNGGDIALHLAPGEHFVMGMVERPDRPSLFGTATLDSAQPVRGIATSGWRGRSFSLGIADAVTVLGDRAAMADAAATVIANAVDSARTSKYFAGAGAKSRS